MPILDEWFCPHSSRLSPKLFLQPDHVPLYWCMLVLLSVLFVMSKLVWILRSYTATKLLPLLDVLPSEILFHHGHLHRPGWQSLYPLIGHHMSSPLLPSVVTSWNEYRTQIMSLGILDSDGSHQVFTAIVFEIPTAARSPHKPDNIVQWCTIMYNNVQ